ncbi:MAG: indole-3-glycerol phosphate synthase TrpC [Candidatus Binatia bacterium]
MILDDIVRDKRADLERTKATVGLAELERRPLFRAERRDLRTALARRQRAIIAEVKKASPSKGVIRPDFDPLHIAASYAANGAAAISVLTEERHFQGQLDYLAAIRNAVAVPLLRKDFLFDPYQLYEARAFGADAVLLIVAILSDSLLHELLLLAETLTLSALVEVHDRLELERALSSGARLLGINNRDLRTFHTSLATTEELVRFVPAEVLAVAESGIETVADIERLERSGVRAFLIGETCMRAPDPGAKLAELLGKHRRGI